MVMPYLVVGPCWACRKIMEFSPTRVPSIIVHDVRQPLCRDCVARANELRAENGHPQIEILPGAYDGVTDDGEL